MLLLSIAIAGSSLVAGTSVGDAAVAGGPTATGPSLRTNVVYAFDAPAPSAPYASLLRRSDGKFYGTLSSGGAGHGALYSYDPVAGTVEILHLFNGADGKFVYTALTDGPGNTFFGTTMGGGASNAGTIFRYDLQLRTLTTLHSFASGSGTQGALVRAADGRLYGAMSGGGSSTSIFRYDVATATFSVVQTLATGGLATTLLEASDGRLYGVSGCRVSFFPRSPIGSASGNTGGTIFRYDPVTSSGEVLYPFAHATGWVPCGPLIQAADGLLYGTTTEGGASMRGVLFRFDPVTLSYAVLHHFDSATGDRPLGGLFQGTDGALYGTASVAGAYGQGTLFRYEIASATLTVRHHFGGSSGFVPTAALIDAGDGSLLGTTYGFASLPPAGRGSIYRYVPATDTVSSVKGFGNGSGSNPQADLLLVDGYLYGTTAEGGPAGEGTLFQYDMAATGLKTVHGFDGAHGGGPVAGLIVGADGALYGTAARGGNYGLGTVFRYDRLGGGGVSALYQFDAGGVPSGRLLLRSDGMLWGTTAGTWPAWGGTVFRYDPGSATLVTLAGFTDATPHAGLVEASDGLLYGTTSSEFSNPRPNPVFRVNPVTGTVSNFTYLSTLIIADGEMAEDNGVLYWAASSLSTPGMIFRYSLTTGTPAIPFHFSGPDGEGPRSSLTRGPDGAFYGTTELGGDYGLGTVFRFDPVTSTHDVIHAFRGSDGANPRAGVVFNASGTMFGTTAKGGPKGGGVIFRILRWR